MRINPGIENELKLIEAINGKRFDELDRNLQYNMKAIFKIVPCETFLVTKEDPRAKPDIAITYHGETHHISIKSGGADHIHCEDIKKFILTLRSYGISVPTQKTILRFQFGDGTLDGTGTIRYPYETVFLEMQEDIKKANIELNRDKGLVIDLVTKYLFEGNFSDLPSADYIYYGTPDYGYLVSRTQIEKHLARKNYSYLYNLHIGPVQFGPRARFINFDEKDPQRRYYVAFKWED